MGLTTVAFSSTCIEKTSHQQSNRADDRNSQSRWGKVRWILLLNVIQLYDIFRNIILCNLKRIFINSSSFLLLDPRIRSEMFDIHKYSRTSCCRREKNFIEETIYIDYVNDSSYYNRCCDYYQLQYGTYYSGAFFHRRNLVFNKFELDTYVNNLMRLILQNMHSFTLKQGAEHFWTHSDILYKIACNKFLLIWLKEVVFGNKSLSLFMNRFRRLSYQNNDLDPWMCKLVVNFPLFHSEDQEPPSMFEFCP